jgi:flagellar biosynthesis protein FlhG
MLNDTQYRKKSVKTIAVASGKGGVGKTNIAASLAIALRKLGKNVVIVDADLGLSSITILLNKQVKYTIRHLLEGAVALKDILIEGPHGIKILPGGDGVQDLTNLDEFQRLRLLEAFDSYDGNIDVLLIDISAGISENVTFFCSAAQELIIVTTPEPTAWVAAYHLIKVLYNKYKEIKFHVLVNSVKNEVEARDVFTTLENATDKFLSTNLNYLGYLPYDEDVKHAVRAQRAFIDLFPKKFISKCVAEISAKILDQPDRISGTLQFFIGKLLSSSIAVEQDNSLAVKQAVGR